MSVTETVTPSVRGWQKARVVALLLASAGGAGWLLGSAAGAAWVVAGLPPAGGFLLVALLAGTALADIAYWRRGRPAPLSVRRQVPRMWTSLFGPETVAVLYGARLGVGPLTILSTWAWWTALVVGATAGPGPGGLAGGLFGVTRVLLMVLIAEWAREDMAHRMGHLRRHEVIASVLLVATYLLLLPISLR